MTGPWDDPHYVPDPGGAPTPWPATDPVLAELAEIRIQLALVERRLAATRWGLALITVGYFLVLFAGTIG
jgi:hypothetical protein